jgi:hypothetical protein
VHNTIVHGFRCGDEEAIKRPVIQLDNPIHLPEKPFYHQHFFRIAIAHQPK